MNIIVAREKSRVMLSEDAVLVFLLFLLNTLVGLLYILGLFLLVRLKRGEGERERERDRQREREREIDLLCQLVICAGRCYSSLISPFDYV